MKFSKDLSFCKAVLFRETAFLGIASRRKQFKAARRVILPPKGRVITLHDTVVVLIPVSQNTNNNLGYVTIKYAPNGTQLWATRFDSTNYPNATPSAFALDSSNNVVVTGNALTIKYDTSGNQLWTAPYDGAGIALAGC
jgi:hypothetical protein